MERKLHPTSNRERKIYSPQDIVMELTDIYGNPLGDAIKSLIKYGKKKNIFIVGPPGGGKSTIFSGIIAMLKDLGMKYHIYSFDEKRNIFLLELKQNGREIENLGQLNSEETTNWRKRELDEFSKLQVAQKEDNANIVGEFPGGFSKEVERGQVLLEHAAEGPKDFLILFVLAERRVYERAIKTRGFVPQVDNDFSFLKLLEAEGIFYRTPTKADKKSQELRTVYAKSATPLQIQGIYNEYQSYVDKQKLRVLNLQEIDLEYKDEVDRAIKAIQTVALQKNGLITRDAKEWERMFYWATAAIHWLHEMGFHRQELNFQNIERHFIIAMNLFVDRIDQS